MSFALRLVLLFSFIAGAAAAAEVPVPALTARVTDTTGTLTAQQKAELEQRLAAFEKEKGAQIAVLMVPTARPEAIEQFAIRVAEQWKIGRKGVDDGAILVIALRDRELRIEVGYGLEGTLTDATANRIIDEHIVPRFRQGDFYGGINAGVGRMMQVISGEPLPPPKRRAPAPGGSPGQILPVIFVIAIALGGILRALFGRFLGAAATGGAVGFVAWLIAGTIAAALVTGLMVFLFTLIGGAGRRWGTPVPYGGWGGYRGGGFGGGGFGGGGFRGGGGGFGGGGASGRW